MADISLDFNALSNSYQDFLVSNNDLVMTDDLQTGGTDPVLQDIIQNIKWIAAEWFLDISRGVPWFQAIFIKNPDRDVINQLLFNVISGTPGVVAVTSYSFTPNFASRSFAVKFSAQKSSGTIYYNGSVSF